FCKDKDMRRFVLRLLRDWRRQVYPTFLSNPYNYHWNFLKENGFFSEEELQRWDEENQFEEEYIFEENAEEQRLQDQKDSEVKASELSTHHKGGVNLSKVTQLLVLSEIQDDDSNKGGNELIRKLSKKEQQQWQPRSPVKMQGEPLVKKSSLKKKEEHRDDFSEYENLDANRIEKIQQYHSCNWNIQLNCANLIISGLTAFAHYCSGIQFHLIYFN
ncbi:hypothetical protein RFI_30818, partial [Reticulomyxa filosa]